MVVTGMVTNRELPGGRQRCGEEVHSVPQSEACGGRVARLDAAWSRYRSIFRGGGFGNCVAGRFRHARRLIIRREGTQLTCSSMRVGRTACEEFVDPLNRRHVRKSYASRTSRGPSIGWSLSVPTRAALSYPPIHLPPPRRWIGRNCGTDWWGEMSRRGDAWGWMGQGRGTGGTG